MIGNFTACATDSLLSNVLAMMAARGLDHLLLVDTRNALPGGCRRPGRRARSCFSDGPTRRVR